MQKQLVYPVLQAEFDTQQGSMADRAEVQAVF